MDYIARVGVVLQNDESTMISRDCLAVDLQNNEIVLHCADGLVKYSADKVKSVRIGFAKTFLPKDKMKFEFRPMSG